MANYFGELGEFMLSVETEVPCLCCEKTFFKKMRSSITAAQKPRKPIGAPMHPLIVFGRLSQQLYMAIYGSFH